MESLVENVNIITSAQVMAVLCHSTRFQLGILIISPNTKMRNLHVIHVKGSLQYWEATRTTLASTRRYDIAAITVIGGLFIPVVLTSTKTYIVGTECTLVSKRGVQNAINGDMTY